MQLEPFLKPESMLVLTDLADRAAVLQAVANHAAELIPGADESRLRSDLADREERFPTSTPEGVAFPHVLAPQITQTILIPCLLRPGVVWGTPGHRAQDVVFAMFGNSERPWEHVRMLARLARIARGPGALDRIRACKTVADLHERMLAEDQSHG